MSGKRQSSVLDHMILSKQSRMEMEHRSSSVACPLKTSSEELFSHKPFLPYSLPVPDGLGMPSPWSSTTAYLQYAGSALSHHLRADGVSGRCHRPEVERPEMKSRVYTQSLETTENHFQVQQHCPVRSYPLSPPHGCPPLAMPKPLYRNPGSYVDAGYGAHGYPSFGVHSGIQHIRPPAVEWNTSTHFTYTPPSVYPPGAMQKTLGLSEPDRSPLSLSLGFQEQNPTHRHKGGTGGAPAQPCPQGEAFLDHYSTYSQSNAQLHCAQGDAAAGRHRSSAFTPSSRHHHTYNSSAFQANLDSRIGQVYSRNHPSPTRDSFPQKSSPLTCSMDRALLPPSVRRTFPQSDRELMVSTAHLNRELMVGITQTGGELHMSETHTTREIRVGPDHADRELWLSSSKTDKEVLLGSSKVNKGLNLGSSSSDGEPLEGSIEADREPRVAASHEDPLIQQTVQNPNLSLSLQNQNVNALTSVHANSQLCFSNQQLKESSQATHVSGLPSLQPNVAQLDTRCVQRSSLNVEPRPDNSSGISIQYQIREENTNSRDPKTPLPSLSCEPISVIPVAEKEVSGPHSPPMPVINDVFSLAPYRAYLEGTAPHPFPAQKAYAENSSVPTSPVSQTPAKIKDLKNGPANLSRLANVSEIVDSEHHSPNNKHTDYLKSRKGQEDSIPQKEREDELVLDLSLKKSPVTCCSPQGKKSCSPQSQHIGFPKAAKSCPPSTSLSLPSQTLVSMPLVTTGNLPPQTRVSSHSWTSVNLPFQTSKSLSPQNSMSHQSQSSPSQTSVRHLSQSSPSQTSVRHPSQSSPSQTSVRHPSQTSVRHPSQSSPLQTSARHPSQSSPSQTSVRHPSQSSPSQSSVRHPPQSSPSQTSVRHPSQSSPSQTSVRHPPQSSPSQTSVRHPPQSSPSQTSVRHPPQSSPSQTSVRHPPQSSPSQTSVRHPPQSSPSQTSVRHPPQSLSSQNLLSQTSMSFPSQSSMSYASQSFPSQTSMSFSSQSFPSQTSMRIPSQNSMCIPSQTSTLCPPLSSSSFLSKALFVCTVEAPTICSSPNHILPNSRDSAVSHSSNASHLCSSQLPMQTSESMRVKKRHSSNSSQLPVTPTGQETEANGFHSSKSFMFKKYKIMKLTTTEGEMQEVSSGPNELALPRPFMLPSEGAQSLPPSAPESSPSLGEANVSLASGGEPTPSGSGQQFTELHRSVRAAISNAVSRSPPGVLQDLLTKTTEEEKPKSPVKSKSSSRSNDLSQESQGHDIWLDSDGVRLALHKLLSQLETFMFTRRCPFPHVIRAGAIFIPIYLVKELLFSELLGTAVDRILQRHKVELRPTTLSEEKLLRDTELKDCPSRMLKLLALKQLPDIYPNLLHLYWKHCIQNRLGKNIGLGQKEDCQTKESSLPSSLAEGNLEIAPPQRENSSLVLKLQRVCQPSGTHVYKAKKIKPSEDSGVDTLKKIPQTCRKKDTARKRAMLPYRKRKRAHRKGSTSKKFPDLVGKRILHLFDDGDRETWFRGKVLRVHRRTRKLRDTQFEVWYDTEPGTRYFLELLQDYEKGWLQLDG